MSDDDVDKYTQQIIFIFFLHEHEWWIDHKLYIVAVSPVVVC